LRYCRFRYANKHRYGVVDDDGWVTPLKAAPWESDTESGDALQLSDIELLPPTLASKIVCVGQNYRKHAEEMGKPIPEEPLIFLKPPSALNAHDKPIRLPPVSNDVQHESELALVIGRTLTRVTEAEAEAGIFALTCFNDVTARDIQKKEIQHTRAKGFDTFACAGPWMVPTRDLSHKDLRIQCLVNGERRQDGRTSDMIFSPARLVSFISQGMTLLPGDLISTGTPSGVGRLSAGDVVEVEIEGIGRLRNPVLHTA
jgi:2-keto-4-pentenoate hydratase/2-oxohepta-3-ene-1,7-dioic acid hydratase in catechol pathway